MPRKPTAVDARRKLADRRRDDFLGLTDRISQSYAGVESAVAEREIAEAVVHARKTTTTALPRNRR